MDEAYQAYRAYQVRQDQAAEADPLTASRRRRHPDGGTVGCFGSLGRPGGLLPRRREGSAS